MFTILIILGCLLFINFLLFTFSVSDVDKVKKKASNKVEEKSKTFEKGIFGQVS